MTTDALVQLRHELHQHPELSGEEKLTAREQFDGCLAKVRALFGGGEGGEEEKEADAALSEECLP